jgi:hypothetical protein
MVRGALAVNYNKIHSRAMSST